MFSIIIRGKISKDIENILPYYRKITDDIILSTWDSENVDDIENKHLFSKILTTTYPQKTTNFPISDDSLLYQTKNILDGLENIKYDLVLILRCDEYYNNINLFELKYLEDTKKLITSNFLFRFPDYYNNNGILHIGDHVIFQEKERLKKCYQNIYDLHIIEAKEMHSLLFEPIIAQSYIETFEPFDIHDKEQHLYFRKKYLTFVNVDELKDYKITNNRLNKIMYNNFDPNDGWTMKSITKYDEI